MKFLTSRPADWNTAGPTLKLWSCSEASLSRPRQELKMRSSVSRSHAFSSLIRASSCSRSELVSGESAERGFSTAATPRPPTSTEFMLADWFCWEEELGPECSERIFWQRRGRKRQRQRSQCRDSLLCQYSIMQSRKSINMCTIIDHLPLEMYWSITGMSCIYSCSAGGVCER